MGRYERITAEVTGEMADVMREAVATGGYASADEVVRDALAGWMLSGRAPQLRDDQLRGLLDAGRDSGPGAPADQVFDRLIAEYTARVEAVEDPA